MREEGRRQQDSVTERAGALERMLDLALGLEPPQAVARGRTHADIARILERFPDLPIGGAATCLSASTTRFRLDLNP